MWVFPKTKNTRIKSSNSSVAHVFVCTYPRIRLCFQTGRFHMSCPPHPKTPNITGVWHPSGDTFPPSTLVARSLTLSLRKAVCAITLYGGKCILSFQITRTARFRFSLSTGHYAQSSGSACCVLVMTSYDIFTGKAGSVAVCLGLPIQFQASADLNFSLYTTKLFTAPIKTNITHTHT